MVGKRLSHAMRTASRQRLAPLVPFQWKRLALVGAPVLLYFGLGTALLGGSDVRKLEAQGVECPELSVTNCRLRPSEPAWAKFEAWFDVHQWVWIEDAGSDRKFRLVEGRGSGDGEAAQPLELRILRADLSQLARGSTTGSTTELYPDLLLQATVDAGFYLAEVRMQGEDPEPPWYELEVTPAYGGQSAPPARAGMALLLSADDCSSPHEVVRGFGAVYNRDASLRRRLGCPTENERGVWMVDQAFQRGLMLWREDDHQIIVMRGADRRSLSAADVHPDRFREGDPEDDVLPPPPEMQTLGLQTPKRGFGRLWRDNLEIRQALGWARTPEWGFQGAVQAFERGLMVWTGEGERWIWVIYQNGDTLVLPDLFAS